MMTSLVLAVALNVSTNVSAPMADTGLVTTETASKGGRPDLYDFGKDAFGWLELRGVPAGEYELVLGELTNAAGHVDKVYGGSSIRCQRLKGRADGAAVFRVPMPKDARNTGDRAVPIPKPFGVVMPFRYVEVVKLPGAAEAGRFVRQTLHVPMDLTKASFACDNAVLNDVYEFCRYSIWATSFAGVYVDGDRERIPYEADAYINQLGHYAVDNDYRMARRTAEWLMDRPTWPTEWLQHEIMIAWADWMWSGETDFLRRHWDRLVAEKSLVAYARASDGLVVSNGKGPRGSAIPNVGDIIDWPAAERDGYDMRPVCGVVNAFHYRNLRELSEMAAALGKTDAAADFAARAKRVRASFRTVFRDAKTGLFRDGEGSSHSSLHVNAAALAFGLAEPSEHAALVAFLDGKGMACSVYFAQYLLEAFCAAGREDLAVKYMAASGERSWKGMIDFGSTITMEAWNVKAKPNLDLNHAWGAAPINVIARCLLGVTPLEPGFARVSVRPRLGGLSRLSGRVPTAKGVVEVKAEGDRLEVVTPVPARIAWNGAVSEVRAGRHMLGGTPSAVPVRVLKEGTDPAALLEEIRAARAAGERGTATVTVRGTVRLEKPIAFTPADRDIVFRGEPGATISGGFAITGWRDRGDGTWAEKLPRGADGKPAYFEQLFVNGRRADCSRVPKGDRSVRCVRKGRWAANDGKPAGANWRADISDYGLGGWGFGRVPEEAFRYLRALSDEELTNVRQIRHLRWDIDRHPVVYLERDIGLVGVPSEQPKDYNEFGEGDPVHYENVRTAFDTAGEWYYDARAGEVLYRPLPGETIATTSFEAPRDGLESLVTFRGEYRKDVKTGHADGSLVRTETASVVYAGDVTFDGIVFECTDAKPYRGPLLATSYQAGALTCCATVLADYARGVKLRRCTVRHNGSYAVWFRVGCVRNEVLGCTFTDLGGGGVKIGSFRNEDVDCRPSGARPATEYGPRSTSFNRVDDCLIADGGRVHMAGCGVLIGHASDNEVTHNEIRDLYYTGVSVGWVWGYGGSVAQRNRIAFNRIHHLGKNQLADMGGVYTLGTSFGTVVANNVIHDIESYGYGGWGLYTDEGSEGVLMENNLVYRTNCQGYHHHYGRNNTLRNNVFVLTSGGRVARADYAKGALAMTRKERHRSVTFERNVTCYSAAVALASCFGGSFAATEMCDWRGNLWWCTTGPVTMDEKNATTFAQWQALGCDTDGAAADPQFVDPAHDDYRLKPTSPALVCGFRPFDPAEAGRRTPSRR